MDCVSSFMPLFDPILFFFVDGGNEETTIEINEGFVAQLMDMGFPLEACKKAVHFTNNQGKCGQILNQKALMAVLHFICNALGE